MRIWTSCIGQRLDGAENTRSMLLCAELLRRGHEVTLWTSSFDHIRKEARREWLLGGGAPYRREDGLEIRFMQGCGYSANVSLRRLLDHWLVARDFSRTAPGLPRPDAIIASLPDHLTAEAFVKFGQKYGVPTVVDVRDKWPDIFVDRVGAGLRGKLANLALGIEHRRTERLLRAADAVVASMGSMLEWGLQKSGRTPSWRERVFYLTTFPKNFDIEHPSHTVPQGLAEALAAVRGQTVFAFVGTFNRTQHPLLVLDAVDRLAASGRLDPSRAAVIIAGDGVDAEEVRRRSARHPNVHYVGWVDSEGMSGLLAKAHVGLLPMNFSSPAFNNKAFAYLASGLPIVNGATGDLADLIDRHDAGVNVRGGDVDQLAEAMDLLANNSELLRRKTLRARQLFCSHFDRDANYQAYAEHIESVARAPRQ